MCCKNFYVYAVTSQISGAMVPQKILIPLCSIHCVTDSTLHYTEVDYRENPHADEPKIGGSFKRR